MSRESVALARAILRLAQAQLGEVCPEDTHRAQESVEEFVRGLAAQGALRILPGRGEGLPAR